jgi:hypothetical protein
MGKKSLKPVHTMMAPLKEDVQELNNTVAVRADCLATNIEYCDRCTHAATQATNMARIKTEGTKGLTSGPSGWVKVWLDEACLQTSNQVLWLGPDSER